jgi:hypothetical protein
MERWYPRTHPPSGQELYARLQSDVELPPPDVDYTDGGRNAVGSFNYLERKVEHLQQQLDECRRQHAVALELITRSANLYLRYFRYRRRFLRWWASLRG